MLLFTFLLFTLWCAQALPCAKPTAAVSGYAQCGQRELPKKTPRACGEFAVRRERALPCYSAVSAWAERAVVFQIPPPFFRL
ncbi:MAG: hypothetical protein ABJF23_25730 [Bryobacteraceae bacterium]